MNWTKLGLTARCIHPPTHTHPLTHTHTRTRAHTHTHTHTHLFHILPAYQRSKNYFPICQSIFVWWVVSLNQLHNVNLWNRYFLCIYKMYLRYVVFAFGLNIDHKFFNLSVAVRKLLSAIFYQFIFFHQMIALQIVWRMFFYFI